VPAVLKPTLPPVELVRLAACEDRIRKGKLAFVAMANALIEIRDDRLYRGTHDTFENYCQERWGFSRQHASRLIQAAEAVRDLSPMGDKRNASEPASVALPTSERQARELVPVPPADRPRVWQAAVEATEGKPTAAAVRQAADQALDREPAPKLAVVNGVEADDPAIVAKLRKAGAIPADVVVEIEEPESPVSIEAEREAYEESLARAEDAPDEEWLAELPVRERLTPARRHDFDRDALLYRALDPARRRLRKAYQDACKANRFKGEVEWAFRKLLKFPHPRDWSLCVALDQGGCGGAGVVGVIGECPACHGRGYRVR